MNNNRVQLASTAQNTTISTQNGGRIILPSSVSKRYNHNQPPIYKKTKK